MIKKDPQHKFKKDDIEELRPALNAIMEGEYSCLKLEMKFKNGNTFSFKSHE